MARKLSVDMNDPVWRAARTRALERDEYKCTECDEDDRAELQVHHIKQRNHGGTHALENLRTLCFECHADIHPWMRKGRWGIRMKSFGITDKVLEIVDKIL